MPQAEPRVLSGSTRHLSRALALAAAALLVARVATGVIEAKHPPRRENRVHWQPAEQAEALALAQRKPILYEFSAEWCGPCRLMQNDVFSDARMASVIDRSFVPVHVVDRVQEEGRNPALVDTLQRRYEVTGFPTLVVVMPGTNRAEQTDGYRGALPTMQWLEQAARRVRMPAGTGPAVILPAPSGAPPPQGLQFHFGVGTDSAGQ